MQQLEKHRLDKPTAILAALVLSAIGAMFYNVLPLYLGIAQDDRQLDITQTGFISGAFFLGYNLVTISAFFWIRKVSWRRVFLITVPLGAAALYLSVLVESYASLLVSTAIAGGAFAAIYGIGTTAVGDAPDPSRWYGVKIATEAALGVVLFLVLPGTLIAWRGFEGLVIGMIVAVALLAPLALGLPHGTGTADEEVLSHESSTMSRGRHLAIWMALAGTLLFFSGQTTVWAFVERLGSAGGFDPNSVGVLLSVSLVFAVSGSLFCAGLGYRWGNVVPFGIACSIFLAALLLLANAADFSFYAAGACAVTFSVGMGLPFAIARVAELDLEGRYVVLSVPAVGIGAMLGPSIAGALASVESLTPILVFSAIVMLGSIILICLFSTRLAGNAD